MEKFWYEVRALALTKIIEILEGRPSRLLTPLSQALVHFEISPCELLHRRFGHLHYKILPSLNSILNGIPELKEDHEGICKGCALGKKCEETFWKQYYKI